MVLKLHRFANYIFYSRLSHLFGSPRLGRVSFRAIKEKRDYLGKRKSASWMYMSRLAAQKEWAFMKVCEDKLSMRFWISICNRFCTNTVSLSRSPLTKPAIVSLWDSKMPIHCKAMKYAVDEIYIDPPIFSRQIEKVPSPGKLYSELMDLIVRFAQAGLIHGDFNEFNILIHRETGDPIVIDFPQMVSTSHENAEW